MRNSDKRLIVLFLISLLMLQYLGYLPIIAETDKDLLPDKIFAQTDFEDQELWGFEPGAGAEATIIEENDNHYLQTSGNGNGDRNIIKEFDQPTTDDRVLIQFDWRPDEVSTGANSSEISFRDLNDKPIIRLIKAGGANGEILFDVGTSGADLNEATVIDGIPSDESWLSVDVLFDFNNENASIKIGEQNNPDQAVTIDNIDFSELNYLNQLKYFVVTGNRASGNTLDFKTDLDNIFIYQSGETAPIQAEQNIQEIITEYNDELYLPMGHEFNEATKILPQNASVELENGTHVDIGVEWSSEDYNPEQVGAYSFVGTLIYQEIPNVKNDHHIQLEVTVHVTEVDELPQIEGYETLYYSDFGDTMEVLPVNWGFTTSNATVSINEDGIAGNDTAKLKFSIVDQSGGRVATKELGTAIKGTQLLTMFDWYPGTVNDRGGNPNENGGEIRLIDGSGNIVFTLNNTKNAPLSYFVGGYADTAVETDFDNPETWYTVAINFDLFENTVTLDLTDQESGRNEQHTVSLDNIAFDGSIELVRLVGNRTSGNNLTWTTYLDNFGFYHKPIPENTIIRVNQLPYHRVYVNETTTDLDSIGLPETVTVTLGDNTETEVEIEKWQIEEKEWDPNESGVYQFTGILADHEDLDNGLDRTATLYVYNRLTPPDTNRQMEWLDRGAIALKADEGIFISWRLLIDEYSQDITFNIYRDDQLLNETPLFVTNYLDLDGQPGDTYTIELLNQGKPIEHTEVEAVGEDYLSIPMQKPEGGITATGEYTYSVNDASVGDLDGDGEYEVIVKWDPSNSIDSSQQGMTGPTIFDAYKLDGTLLWRIDMGLNLTSGAHYHQFIVADFDGDGKSEFLIKTADATTVYGTTDGIFDQDKVIDVIGDPDLNGHWVIDVDDEGSTGHIYGGPEYISVFDGESGEVIDTIDYAFSLGDVSSWGDSWHNRSDRFLAGLAYLDGVKPSAIYGRGYYERTTFVAYSLIDGHLVEEWTFDSDVEGRGGGLGYHSLSIGDVDNDGYDEIIAGSLTLDHDGTILYAMDGEMGRIQGSHGDALHVGAFDPDREGLHVFGVHEDPAVASVEYHDGATGETIMSYFAYKDAGRGVAANITSQPGYEFWGTGGDDVTTGGGIYNVQGDVIADSYRDAGLSVNFALYWDGDLLKELLDDTTITKYNEETGQSELLKQFENVVSNNGTKATPSLQADILGDWREEVLLPTEDSSELRIFSTTIPTEYRLHTLMHDSVYRTAIAWQNVAYNQPPHLGFYLGEDIRDTVLAGELEIPGFSYINQPIIEEPDPTIPEEPEEPTDPEPTVPEEPEEPTDPDPTDPEDELEQNLDDDSSEPEKGSQLPKTATRQFNYLLIGLILSLTGLTIFLVKRHQLNKR